MELLSLIPNIAKKPIEPVYLFHGSERFLIDRAISIIKKRVLQGPMAEFNMDRLQSTTTSGYEIATRARELPMMSSRRLIIVEDAHKLGADDLQELDTYLSQPVPETCLVLIGEKFNLRKGPLAKANKRGQVHKADALKEREIATFLKAQAAERKIQIEGEALSALAAAIGPNAAALDDGLERLSLYAGPGRSIQVEDVTQVVTTVREHSIFELVDAIGNRQSAKALTLLEELLKRREEPIRINAMVARHFRMLLGARIHLYLGTDSQELPSLLGVPPFAVGKLLAQCRKFRGQVLERSLARLAAVDYELKSSRRPGSLVVEQAVMDLCLS